MTDSSINTSQTHGYYWMIGRFILLCMKVAVAWIFSFGPEYKITFPGLRGKVFFRKHSTDSKVFGWTFAGEAFAMPFLGEFSPRVIIDAGAYTGYSTLYFANRYPEAKIIAIEPEPSNFSLLKKNTAEYPNVHCIPAALWSKKAALRIIDNPHGRQWSFRVEEASKRDSSADEHIAVVTIPEIMKDFKFDSVDIVKFDIEGAEKEVFSEQYEDWLKKCKVIVIELHERFAPGCSKAFYSALSRLSFGQYVRRGNVFIDLRKRKSI